MVMTICANTTPLYSSSECRTTEDVWACLSCGYCACGRFAKGHALKHYEDNNSHCVVLNISYECDDYAENDTPSNDLKLLKDKITEIKQLASVKGCKLRSGTLLTPHKAIPFIKPQVEESPVTKRKRLEPLSVFTKLRPPDEAEATASVTSKFPVPDVVDVRVTRGRALDDKHDKSTRVVAHCSLPLGYVVGLKNLGNTCFMNSVLQALNSTPPFRDYFIQGLLLRYLKDTTPAPDHDVVGVLIESRSRSNSPVPSGRASGRDSPTIPPTLPIPTSQHFLIRQQTEVLLPFVTLHAQKSDLVPVSPVTLRTPYKTVPFENVLEGSTDPLPSITIERAVDEKPQNDKDSLDNRKSGSNDQHLKPTSRKHVTFAPVERRSARIREAVSNGNGNNKKHASNSKVEGSTIDSGALQCADDTSNISLHMETRNLFRVMASPKYRAIAPYAFLTSVWATIPQMRGYEQQDSHEFLSFYLDRLDQEIRDARSNWSLVGSCFQGTLSSVVTCKSCNRTSTTVDPFRFISLDIPSSGLTLTRSSPMRRSASSPRFLVKCTLFECLDLFTGAESLDAEVYQCENCKKKTNAVKQFYIRDVPPILIFHVKRFSWCHTSRSKVCSHVTYPLKLDLSLYMAGTSDDVYELRSVICHHGDKLSSGHYTAYVYDDIYGNWMHANDDKVDLSTADDVLAAQAYMLFYVRVAPQV